MGSGLKYVSGGWIAVFLSAAHLAGAGGDLRLLDAARNRDAAAVRSLLSQHADVNAAQADGSTALAWAVYFDDPETAELLIHGGANVNAANEYGVTPLTLACENGNARLVDRLLQAGANPNAAQRSGVTALMTAARASKNVEVVNALLAHGANVNVKETGWGQTALMWAVAELHLDVVRALLAHGADVHARSNSGFTPLLFAARVGDLDSAEALLAAGANVNEATPEVGSALVLASASGHEALSIFLLDKGANPNATDDKGITALHYAVQYGLESISGIEWQSYRYGGHGGHTPLPPDMPELVKALLDHGANPNARIAKDYPLFSRAASRPSIHITGATPFFLAAAADDSNIMRLLHAKGADPLLTTDEKTTPLMVAAGVGRVEARPEAQERNVLEAIKLAIELGGDVNAVADSGWTALHGAAYTGADESVRFLIGAGAKINVKNGIGQTPLSIAQGFPGGASARPGDRPYMVHESTVKLLQDLGGAASAPVPRSSDVSKNTDQ